jgi:acetate kinase
MPEKVFPPSRICQVLTINSGSSSLKCSIFHLGDPEARILSGGCEGIEHGRGRFHLEDAAGRTIAERRAAAPDHASAARDFLDWLARRESGWILDGVGHRVVHGGLLHSSPQLITPELERQLGVLGELDPEHMAHELRVMDEARRIFPHVPQVACFDTAFHRTMPRVAQMHPLPRELFEKGMVRFGFHGLSYQYIVQELARVAGPGAAGGRLIVAHLGSGASMAAIRGGESVDTTMGYMPNGGLMMGARPGDLSPGVLLDLMIERKMSPAEVNEMVNFRSGLLGVSGLSPDVRVLLAAEAGNPAAADALALYCHIARKHLGALAAVLGGVDTLVFTAGIGENSPAMRGRICENLGFLGIRVDAARNLRNEDVISPEGSAVTVRVMRTREDLMIARAVRQVLHAGAPA